MVKFRRDIRDYTSGLILAALVCLAFYYFLDVSKWFIYSKVLPQNEGQFCIGQYPSFKSVVDIRRETVIEWREAEYCLDENGEFERGAKRIDAKVVPMTDGLQTSKKPWRFDGFSSDQLQQEPTTCYLQIEAIKPAPLDILREFFDKKQLLTSELYEYIECN